MPAIPELDTMVKDPMQQLQDAGMHVFMGDVDNESIKPIVEWI